MLKKKFETIMIHGKMSSMKRAKRKKKMDERCILPESAIQ